MEDQNQQSSYQEQAFEDSDKEIYREAYTENRRTDGGLSKVQAMWALFAVNLNPTALEIAVFWDDNDKSDNDELSYDEFKRLISTFDDPVDDLTNAFKYFDKNDNNTIEKDELEAILKKSNSVTGMDLDAEDIAKIIKESDTSADGHLRISVLVDMITKNKLDI